MSSIRSPPGYRVASTDGPRPFQRGRDGFRILPKRRGNFETLGQCKDYANLYPIVTEGLTSISLSRADIFMRLKYQRYGRALRARHELWIYRRSPRTAEIIRRAREKLPATSAAMKPPGANDNIAAPEAGHRVKERASRTSS